MAIEVRSTKAHGREKDLLRLNKQRNDPYLSHYVRRMADQAHVVIVSQLRDRTYLSLRERLIKATQAGDQVAIAKIELLIRDHQGEDKFAASGAKEY